MITFSNFLQRKLNEDTQNPQPYELDDELYPTRGHVLSIDDLKGLMDPDLDKPAAPRPPKKPPVRNKTYMKPELMPGYIKHLQAAKNPKPVKKPGEFDDFDFSKVNVTSDLLNALRDPTDPEYKDLKPEPAPFKALNIPTGDDVRPSVAPPKLDYKDKGLNLSSKEAYVIKATRMGVPDEEILKNLGYKTAGPARKWLNQVRSKHAQS